MKKKALVLSSSGGYGHSAASSTLSYLLRNEWDLEVFHPINELKICGLPSGESIYNFLISRNYTHLMNWMAASIAPYLFHTRVEKTVRLIERRIAKEKPDLLISLIPYVNYPASEAARRSDIPFLLISTDNDLYNWVIGLDKMTHSRVKITIGHDLPLTRGMLLKKGISPETIETIGLPLRPVFQSSIDKQRLRFQHGILPNRSVVLIMMGGAGGMSAFEYAKRLAALPLNLHLIVCAGRNRPLATRLASLPLAGNNRLEVLPFTERVHELMALCDILITKPGPGTLNEAMALRLPLLIDRTTTPLYWEEVNIDLVQKLGIGKALYSMEGLEMIINQMLHPSMHEQIQLAYDHLPPNQFHEKLPGIINDLCQHRVPSYETASFLESEAIARAIPPV